MAADATAGPAAPRPPGGRRFLIRAPTPAVTAALLVAAAGLLTLAAWLPAPGGTFALEGFLLVFLPSSLLAGLLSGPLAAAFGGYLPLRRSLLLALTAALLMLPLLLVYRLLVLLPYFGDATLASILLFVQGPVLWFRHMSLFGVSRPSHLRSIPASALQPVLAVLGVLFLYGATPLNVVAAIAFLAIGFLTSALLLRAADRPLRREFGVSGVSLIRPLLDHVNDRDPRGTDALEAFFRRFAIPVDLSVGLVQFRAVDGPRATVVLPGVHPGPFASLGASDLPRKIAAPLGDRAGTVLVPHTPCNHDLDLPTGAEVARVGEAVAELLAASLPPQTDRASPLLSPHAQSIARAQLVGDTVLVLVSQAPDPTDDIDLAVADQLLRESAAGDGVRVALIDAHNSYVEARGDIVYGTPAAGRLLADGRAAIAQALAAARPGPVEVGAATRSEYTVRGDGIGPAGIRALVVRAGGTTTAYALIDGNNLVLGYRAQVLAALAGLVDAGEVMTTDNHVVHEVDGGTNPVGERISAERLSAEVRAVVEEAKARLAPVRVYGGSRTVPGVPALGPDFTARLLTSLGDTVSMFSNAFLMTFLLTLAASLVVLVAIA